MIDISLLDPTEPPMALAVVATADGVDVEAIEDLLSPAAAETVRAFVRTSPPSTAAGEVSRLPMPTTTPGLVLFVGAGAGDLESLRDAGAAIARQAGCADLAVVVSPVVDGSQVVEGLLLGDYRFRVSDAAEPGPVAVKSVRIRGVGEPGIERAVSSAGALRWVRELANTRSGVKTPQWLGEQARRTLEPLGVKVAVRDVAWLGAQRFGGVLAVGAGSAASPRLIEATWRPRGADPKAHIVLVGKSITYDSGGLNIKPLDSMFWMHTDMAAGAAVLGALRLVAERKLPVRVTALLPAAENSVSGSAMRPSDVVRHYGGRTSEIGNTDAEGRLVLADAMAYAVARLKPSVLVDIATLTGAMKVALGQRTGGFFATSDDLAVSLAAAGDAVGEPLWRLPLAEQYLSLLDSPIADATNSPGNPGAITAALFLRPFAGDVPWAHLDVAGSGRSSADAGERSVGATGFGARLLAEWIERATS